MHDPWKVRYFTFFLLIHRKCVRCFSYYLDFSGDKNCFMSVFDTHSSMLLCCLLQTRCNIFKSLRCKSKRGKKCFCNYFLLRSSDATNIQWLILILPVEKYTIYSLMKYKMFVYKNNKKASEYGTLSKYRVGI